jgi:hypothetical protein
VAASTVAPQEYIYHCERPSSLVLLAKGLLLWKLLETLRPYVVRTLTEIPEGSPFELVIVLIVTIVPAGSIGLAVHFFIEWLLP